MLRPPHSVAASSAPHPALRLGATLPRFAHLAFLALALVGALALPTGCGPTANQETRFIRLMNTGKNYYDQGQAEKALPVFAEAVTLYPSRPDAQLNLANAYLLAGQPEGAVRHAQEALQYDRNFAAAYYVAGCAHLRLRQFEPALQMFQLAHDLDATVAAVSFQMGRAQVELGHLEEAIQSFQETLRLEPEHPVAYYTLSQALIRATRQEEGLKALAQHEVIRAKAPNAPATPDTYERCKHTQARAPQQVLRPDPQGIPVRFADATEAAFAGQAARYQAPLAFLDFNHDNRNSLFVAEGTNGYRLLENFKGAFQPRGEPLPRRANPHPPRALVADLNNDRFEDVLLVGETASQAFRFATNGAARDVTAAAGLKSLVGAEAVLLDLDFTGKLDLLAVLPQGQGLRVLRNLGNMYFKDITATSGVPHQVTGLGQVVVDDWNNDDLLDGFVGRSGQPPLYLQKIRGGPLVPTNLPPGQLEGPILAIGDLNGDSRVDLLAGSPQHVDLLLGAVHQFRRLPLALPGLRHLRLIDYDNDGWLDLLAAGDGLALWRNLGDGQFTDTTRTTGLDAVRGTIDDLAAADTDCDGDTDLVVSLAGQGLRLLRNDGGNAHQQVKIRLLGNRSNASGLGIRVELAAGSFRVHRTVQSLPLEIGVGTHTQLDSLTARWFDLAFNQVDIKPDPCLALEVFEPVLPTGSCPYLYAWDGRSFRFISDILGSAPLGLRVTETVFADADPFEYVWLGDETLFPPHEDHHVLQITEELREVLYLDHAALVVVDHPPGTEVHTTDKFRPAKPFPRGELWTLENRRPLRQAHRLDGVDVTAALQANDQTLVSPLHLRIPQLRGLAEPHGVLLDFGPLPTDQPLVLVLTGWLRFGGGMANVAAAHHPDLPFPFPQLEVEVAPDQWQPVDVTVGAPSGKTKTILVDLAGRLPQPSARLRLTTAFEIHWDRIALFTRRLQNDTHVTRIPPSDAHLHWRGFSEFADLPWTQPLTPVYDRVTSNPPWSITPTGWCTRYGRVDELIAHVDNALALLNGGDELTLRFPTTSLPPKPAGAVRDFFLYSVGWDKDADFHVELGWKVDPLPWHGMDDQLYGRQPRPAFESDALLRRYTTRWVGQPTLQRAAR